MSSTSMRKGKFSIAENNSSVGYFNVFSSSEWNKLRKQAADGDLYGKDKPLNRTRFNYCMIMSFLSVLSLLILGIIYLGSMLHTETYLWQSTALADYLTPVNRTSCLIKPGPRGTTPYDSSPTYKIPKVALVFLYSDTDGTWEQSLMQRVLKNRESYCKKHGCTLVNGNSLIDPTRPAAWSKLLVMKDTLKEVNGQPKFDLAMYMDMDAVIMNPDWSIEDFVKYQALKVRADAATQKKPIDPELKPPSIIITEDWSGPNTGVWIARSGEFTEWLLQAAWNVGSTMLAPYTASGVRFPFEYEQRAIHYLLGTDKWKDRGLPEYKQGDGFPYTQEQIRAQFAYLPQCAFNSFAMHPLLFKGDREKSQYVPGDFLVHLAGKKGRGKTDLLQYYLNIAEAQYPPPSS